MSSLSERYITQHIYKVLEYYECNGLVESGDLVATHGDGFDPIAEVAWIEGLDLDTQRDEVLERAAHILETLGAQKKHQDRMTMGGYEPRGETRDEAKSRIHSVRMRTIETTESTYPYKHKWSLSQQYNVYVAEVRRRGRDAELGQLTEQEYEAALAAEPERQQKAKEAAERAKRDRARQEEAELQRQERMVLAEDRAHAEGAWKIAWPVAALVAVGVAYLTGWRIWEWPSGVFGTEATGKRTALHMLRAGALAALALFATEILFGRLLGARLRHVTCRSFWIPATVLIVIFGCATATAFIFAGPEILQIASNFLATAWRVIKFVMTTFIIIAVILVVLWVIGQIMDAFE